MKIDEAKQLVTETFDQSFNKEIFTYFTKNLLEGLDPKTFIYRGQTIPNPYKNYIKTLSRVGKYTDPDGNKIDVLIVQLKKETSLERARTMQRNFIAWYLKRSRSYIKDAALVAFVAPNQDDWRFSLVKLEYDLKKDERGKVKIKRELTPARRWSFLVGEHENTHTARKQLLPLLEKEKLSLDEIENAFDIEVVTKEFFKKYRELYHRVKEKLDKAIEENKLVEKDFKKKGVDTSDFAKKLLGQIVFLYFLQKKGWFGVARDAEWGTGPKNFLRQLFEGNLAEYDNFFEEILEPLFYEALAVERPDDYYSRFNCKIPFLNGGLFDPIFNYNWVHDDIGLPNELFSNKDKTKEGDLGTGILDVFDRYNFTVREDEPLEKEVAIDPEMLGKVFENLLEVKDRKSKGTYYTPREIVHYMCQESLINYLITELSEKVDNKKVGEDVRYFVERGETLIQHEEEARKNDSDRYDSQVPEIIEKNAQFLDDKLKEIKVCDPAVGSGAFPVGMMKEIVSVRKSLTPFIDNGNRSTYQFKRRAIQNSLYGVDIDPGAVEIAKLRLWLSLIVDEESRHNIRALPNLDYKIMQGNSLLEEYEGVKLIDKSLFESKPDSRSRLQELKDKRSKLQREYFNSLSADNLSDLRKTEIEKEIAEIQKEIKAINNQNGANPDKPGLFAEQSEAREKAKKLQEKQKEFFTIAQKSQKDELKQEIEDLTWDLIETSLK